jgi:hypothetical protein
MAAPDAMKLSAPFAISARLLPAVNVAEAWISLDGTVFYLDLPDGSEHVVDDVRPPACGRFDYRKHFSALLSFLGACAESRAYGARTGCKGENSDLFSEAIGAWAEENSDKLSMLACEIEESAVEGK